jgi:hypothetical protein
LLPAVRKAGLATIVVADGFSCKEQIAQETNRHALHLAEVLNIGLQDGNRSQDVMYPEKQFVVPRKRAQRESMVRAGVVTLGALALAITGAIWANRRRG